MDKYDKIVDQIMRGETCQQYRRRDLDPIDYEEVQRRVNERMNGKRRNNYY